MILYWLFLIYFLYTIIIVILFSIFQNMRFPNFMRKKSKEQEKAETAPREKVVDDTAKKIWNIVRYGNCQWESFNNAVWYLEKLIVESLDLDVNALKVSHAIYLKKLALALTFPWFSSWKDFDEADPGLEEIQKKNQVDRVSIDSLRRRYILQALNEILKISSSEKFWNRNYKIWDIEINSFEDLEKNRGKLEDMREKWENYNIPGYKEAVEYAAKKGINTNFYE